MLLLGCQPLSGIPQAIEGLKQADSQPTINLYQILDQFAENQGWPEPEAGVTCADYYMPWPPGTTCFQPIEVPSSRVGGLNITNYEVYGSTGSQCYVTSMATIYTFRNAEAAATPSADGSMEYTAEEYRNVAVDHYTWQGAGMAEMGYQWYYDDLTFTVSGSAYGENCQTYFPNTQAFQFLIDLMEQGYTIDY